MSGATCKALSTRAGRPIALATSASRAVPTGFAALAVALEPWSERGQSSQGRVQREKLEPAHRAVRAES
jgi:hypothetical protein